MFTTFSIRIVSHRALVDVRAPVLRVHRVPSPAGDAPLGAGGSAVKLAALVAGRAEALLVVAVRLVEA